MILKTAATTLFQKTSRTPITLAIPEVTVITWSGPAYSANNSKRMKAPSLTTLEEVLFQFYGSSGSNGNQLHSYGCPQLLHGDEKSSC